MSSCEEKGGTLTPWDTETAAGTRTIYPVAQHCRVAPGAEKTALTEWIFPHPLKPEQPTRPSAASDKTESSHRLPAGDQVYPKARYRLHL